MNRALRRSIAGAVVVFCGAAFAMGGVFARPDREVTTCSDEAYDAYGEAMEHSVQLRYQDAQRSWRRAVELDPNFAMAWARIANLCMAWGQRDSAIVALARARASEVRLHEIERLRIDQIAARIQGRPEDEFAASHAILERYPNDTESMLSIHRHSRIRGDLDTCLEMLERALAIDPEDVIIYNELGYVLADLGRYEEAMAAFQKYAFINADEPNPHDSLGELYERVGRYEDALAKYQRATEVDPRFRYAYAHEARVSLTLGRFDRAETILEAAAGADDGPGAEFSNGVMRVELVYRRDGVKAMVEAIAALPPTPESWQTDSLWIAAWGARLAGDTAALAAVNRRLDAMRSRLDAEAPGETFRAERISRARLFTEAQSAWMRGDLESARAATQDLLGRRFEWFATDCLRLDLADLLIEMGRFEDAAAELNRILERDRLHPDANLRMGRAMAGAGRFAEAAARCAIALGVWADSDPGHRSVAEAERLFEESLSRSGRALVPPRVLTPRRES